MSDDGKNVLAAAQDAVAELQAMVARVDPAQLAALHAAVLASQRVYLTGSGRSGLMAKAVAMRLMHIGLSSYAVGEIATPAIGAGDLLIAISARGGNSIVDQIHVARAVGATVAALSSSAGTAVAQAADLVVAVPARVDVPTVQHAGSLFEQSCLVLGDALCRTVQKSLGVGTEELNARHANLS